MANPKGEAWITYGDGHLRRSHEGLKHVVLASSISWLDFLATFISGASVTTRWQAVWSEFPAYYYDDERASVEPCLYSSNMGTATLRQ